MNDKKLALFDRLQVVTLLDAARAVAKEVDRQVRVTIYSENPESGSSTVWFESVSSENDRLERATRIGRALAAVKGGSLSQVLEAIRNAG